jgi:membrane-associated phospholipid phosphatase
MNIILFILGLASFFLYFPMESRKAKGHYLETKFDRKIPMVAEFVVPYILFFPYILVIFVWAFFTKNPLFGQLAISVTAVSITTTIIYLGFPTKMMRPFQRKASRAFGLSEKLVKAIEKFDHPNNVFPSNHVAYTLVFTLFMVAAIPTFAWLFWLIFGLISVSTVMIKQHYLVDVPAGAFLAITIWYLVEYFV